MDIKNGVHSVILYILIFFVGVGTYAYFSNENTSNNSTFASGVLRIGVGDIQNCSTVISPQKWVPSVEVKKNLIIENVGTLPFTYSISAEILSGDERLTDLIKASITKEDGTVVCNNTSLSRLKNLLITDALGKSDKEKLYISLIFEPERADNSYQNAKASVNLRFDAVQ